MTREEFKISMGFTLALVLSMLMGLAVLFSSCGSHRSNMKQDISTDFANESHKTDSTSSDKKVQVTESGNVTEAVESYEVIYDTDKPIDPATGKPPIKSEKWTGANKKSELNRQENTDNKENSISNESTFSRQQEDVHLKADEQTDEPTFIKQIGFAGAGIALLIISCIIAWLVYKKRRKKGNQ
mgnify:CR=1 FL=1